ncbi:hypothetical protein JF634_12165 [Simonsiella muelleri]|nr:hypothetical protein [Simonsiella muelleri]UBQ53886.1 hypothetical protein JF634_12165 [Simonsiella muelleri]
MLRKYIFYFSGSLNMLTQIPHAINKSSRLLTLRHPNAVDVWVYRKIFTRQNPETLGGALVLSNEDEDEYELIKIGEGKMLFLGRISGSDFAVNTLDYGENDVVAYIVPLNENEFEPKNDDRIIWIGHGFAKHYQIHDTASSIQMPMARMTVFHLQPLEQPFDFENGDIT